MKFNIKNDNIIKKITEENKDKRIIFVYGNFNIIHPGHLRLINFARTCGDYLVVGLYKDSHNSVILPYKIREESLYSLEAVSKVLPIVDESLTNILLLLRPYAVVKGKEHEFKFSIEKEILKSYGGHLIFSAGEANFSSIDLIRKELVTTSGLDLKLNSSILNHNGSSIKRINGILSKFKDTNVLVIGDLILDEYIHCDPLGMSQEEPTIVVTPVESRRFIGGAGIVASHMSSLGANVKFISITGDDQISIESKKILNKFKVKSTFIKDSSRPTILKQRFRANNKTLLKVSTLRSHDVEEELVNKVASLVLQKIKNVNIVVFSDFNYGCLPQILVDKIIEICRENNVPFTADSQASSQISDISRYRGAKLLAATEREARLALSDFKSGIQNIANNLIIKANANSLLLKLGAEGLIALKINKGKISTSLVNAYNYNPVDVSGAGDAMLSASSLAIANGGTLWECAFIGSIASAIQISSIGNTPLKYESIKNEINKINNVFI